MRPMEMAGKLINDAVRVASMKVKTFVFEDVRLPSGWTATVAVRYDGTVDGYSLVTPDGMGMVDGSGHHGTADMDGGMRAVREMAALAMTMGDVEAAHVEHRRKRIARARIIADIERFDPARNVTFTDDDGLDTAIAGQTQALIRSCVESFDPTNETSADADWKDGDDDGN